MGRVAHISFVRNEDIEQLLLLIYLFSRRHEIIYNTSSFLTVLTSLPTLLSTFASCYMRRLDYVHNQQSMYLEHLLDNSGEHYLTAIHSTRPVTLRVLLQAALKHKNLDSASDKDSLVEETRIYMPNGEGIRARNPFASVP